MAVDESIPAGGRPDRLTGARLKADRDWTDAAIRRFLPEPDATAPNPHYRTGPPMRLYDLARIETVEASEEWQSWHAGAEQRRAAARERADIKRDELHDEVAQWDPEIPDLDDEDLYRRAVAHRNGGLDWYSGGGWQMAATVETADPAALKRWAVNYLRHCGSDYDALLNSLARRVGRRQAAQQVRERAYDAIAEQYPFLAAECWRQFDERQDGGGWTR